MLWRLFRITPLAERNVSYSIDREFERLYLWALDRKDIRRLVLDYNQSKYIADDNVVISRIVSDLEVLNIPRTSLNCLTILKIYESSFDDSPVNRTEMIRRVMFLLFNVDFIPDYKNRLDLGDSEYVLGYFCERIIREKDYCFTREYFLSCLMKFCSNNEIDIDVDVIFDVLYRNNIIINRFGRFCFKFSYWVYYFAAHRMHQDESFAEYILSDMNYAAYPELMEFYTGIDRRRNNALDVLVDDLSSIRSSVESNCGIPSDFNIYDLARWNPSEEEVEKINNEISDGVLNSNMPEELKDEYADKCYDRMKPLHQDLNQILDDYALVKLINGLHASAKALRNSDYANADKKHELLGEILLGFDQIIKVLIAVSPLLARDGYAYADGVSVRFICDSKHNLSFGKLVQCIISVLPSNIVRWYRDDLFSNKMGSLLYKHADQTESNLTKHIINRLIVQKRPNGWKEHIQKYISSENKNSFYLLDIFNALRVEYQYGFVDANDLNSIESLIKAGAAKHQGVKHVGPKAISKVTDEVLPERRVD